MITEQVLLRNSKRQLRWDSGLHCKFNPLRKRLRIKRKLTRSRTTFQVVVTQSGMGMPSKCPSLRDKISFYSFAAFPFPLPASKVFAFIGSMRS